MATYARRSARVLLLDGTGRLLLIKYALGAEGAHGHAWYTPGGGIDDGEDLAAAAARELLEEAGLAVDPARLRPVAYTTGHADLGWAKGLFRDDFFLHRVTHHRVDTSGLTDFERTRVLGYRWWTPGELDATTDLVYPLRLAPLVADLVAGRVPPRPVELPWHHPIRPDLG